MNNNELIEQIVLDVIKNISKERFENNKVSESNINDNELIDITDRYEFEKSDLEDDDDLRRMKNKTPARIGIGKAGPRIKTKTLLRLRADHAIARDAVMMDVDTNLLDKLNFFAVQTKCTERNQFLTRTDLGRQLSEEAVETIKNKCKRRPQVQIYASDGLSSSAIESNLENVYLSLKDGLDKYNINIGTPFFVKFGRVPAMDEVTEVIESDVTCLLIGERPGLVTSKSMSAYITYKGTVGMPESRRTVISNIHEGGIPAVEAGAYIADVIKKMLDNKVSGVDLKL